MNALRTKYHNHNCVKHNSTKPYEYFVEQTAFHVMQSHVAPLTNMN